MTQRVVVVGAGLVGLCTAFSLHERGVHVTVLDHGPIGGGASRGNAGWICPTQLGPLANPHALLEAVRNVGRPLSPVYLRPAGAPALTGWLGRFVWASRSAAVARGRRALLELDRVSADALHALDAAGAELRGPRGIVVVHHSADAAARSAASYGVTDVLTGGALAAVAPFLARPHELHGALLPGDRAIDPSRFVDSLAEVLLDRGVTIVTDAPLDGFDDADGVVRAVRARGQRFEADAFVLAAGAGTAAVARRLGVKLALTAGKGYSFTVRSRHPLPHAVLFEDEHVACTPLGDDVRIAGTMELGGRPGVVDERRVAGMVRSARSLLTDVDLDSRRDTWVGPRPVTADGLPVIGRPKAWRNVHVGTGHGMYGVTLAPATGVVLAELVTNGRSPVDVTALSPDRF